MTLDLELVGKDISFLYLILVGYIYLSSEVDFREVSQILLDLLTMGLQLIHFLEIPALFFTEREEGPESLPVPFLETPDEVIIKVRDLEELAGAWLDPLEEELAEIHDDLRPSLPHKQQLVRLPRPDILRLR